MKLNPLHVLWLIYVAGAALIWTKYLLKVIYRSVTDYLQVQAPTSKCNV